MYNLEDPYRKRWLEQMSPSVLGRVSQQPAGRQRTWLGRGDIRAAHAARRGEMLDRMTAPARQRMEFIQNQMPLGDREKLALQFGQQEKIARMGIEGRSEAADVGFDRDLRKMMLGQQFQQQQATTGYGRDIDLALLREQLTRGRPPTPPTPIPIRDTEGNMSWATPGVDPLPKGATRMSTFSDAGMDRAGQLRMASGLRKEFNSLSADFFKIRDSYNRIVAAANDPSAAGDLAIIFNYMKILDPGSVVRESEFATAANAAGVPDRVRNMWNQMISGQRIAFNRGDFVNQAQNLYNARMISQNDLISRYTNIGQSYGVDTNLIFGNLPPQAAELIDYLAGQMP